MEHEKPMKILDADKAATRRDFLKKMGGLIALFILPAERCSNGGNGGVKPCVSFEITFSTPMDRASVEGALNIEPAIDAFFSGDFTWSNGDATVYYKRNVPQIGQTYTITIAPTAADKNGNLLDGNGDGTGGDAYAFNAPGV